MHRAVAALAAVVTALVAGCGADATPGAQGDTPEPTLSAPPPATDPSPAQTAPSPTPPTNPGQAVTTGDSEFGPMLFDDRGQAIYLFDKETTAPGCYDECALAWPPVLTTGPPRAAGAVRADLLGTVARQDGSTQVTYAGHPLYYYAHEGPGQVLCHNVRDFGGLWLVVTPEGSPAP